MHCVLKKFIDNIERTVLKISFFFFNIILPNKIKLFRVTAIWANSWNFIFTILLYCAIWESSILWISMIEFRILLNLFTFSSIIFIFILSFPLFYTSELNDISLFPFTYTAIRQSKRNYTIKWIKKKKEKDSSKFQIPFHRRIKVLRLNGWEWFVRNIISVSESFNSK